MTYTHALLLRYKQIFLIMLMSILIYAFLSLFLAIDKLSLHEVLSAGEIPTITEDNMILYLLLLLGIGEIFSSFAVTGVSQRAYRATLTPGLTALLMCESAGLTGLIQVFLACTLEISRGIAFFVASGLALIAFSAVFMTLHYHIFTRVLKSSVGE